MLVVLRGAGDIASGIALRLWHAGLQVVLTDLEKPTAIRRTVCFSQAILLGKMTVEDATAVLAKTIDEVPALLTAGFLPVLVDPDAACVRDLHPDGLVDAILAKRNLGTRLTDAPIVIGVGPGFTAGVDCHAVVETMRGHSLGRVIRQGSALPNTAVPGLIGGFAGERVLRAPADGLFHQLLDIGAAVKTGDAAGSVDGIPMVCTIGGVLRGILPEGTRVTRGMKSGDVDPRGEVAYCHTVSDKALAVGGGVLEALLAAGTGRGTPAF
ncbi:MAG: selenium-dependent molybdenum cofactor biosynthesis protein YqeB [Oscillospiraceae bacterium]